MRWYGARKAGAERRRSVSGLLKAWKRYLPMSASRDNCRRKIVTQSCQKCLGHRKVLGTILWLTCWVVCDRCRGLGWESVEETESEAKAGGQPDE